VRRRRSLPSRGSAPSTVSPKRPITPLSVATASISVMQWVSACPASHSLGETFGVATIFYCPVAGPLCEVETSVRWGEAVPRKIPVVSFLTMKGGVGKTTLAANITRAIADVEKRKILLIDTDAQCNLTRIFADPPEIDQKSARAFIKRTMARISTGLMI
jgi:Mrp family chromosome partitioning ATPase